ncbi:cAMP-dependent protein kinase inhibitor gamma isoform X1 [Canis lupus familiaris]|uniref:cAMP-dependent protein kinase inhibitor gamma isoform X1 n=1 Tax=Canis lupus familiaris TaxID=9615 RepID=UPI000BAA28B4|nr:cAMP-dependent protein kinase inhibitor gamma isoform X1 [Canis lupus familiaris]XP_038289846.1 cAMP-dependent protein kinase inhibitor gamma isoform X1 [Canis lupus familiaris]XP_038428340.1 cAMP-dependent protein kinase inhibitor gamma isoform X1 [Canis lupus familiaris]|eukprot:XP_022265172.1 cAMP-dependent protein kinase inhibitor gamma isoform X1 [Canis lupus familiaris]
MGRKRPTAAGAVKALFLHFTCIYWEPIICRDRRARASFSKSLQKPLLRLKGNASATPPTSVFSTLNIPSLASFCLWPGSLLEPSLYLMTERETEAKTGSENFHTD